ncbi:MAG: hypothetical protein M1817_003809 [Caeruleum heppii]|nr:MAG: hypothetical protein M1817_003809 [Caeruleum heppii]
MAPHDDASHGSSHSTTASGSGGHGTAFTTAHTTPLYSSSWTPTSTGAYAGTCLFLVVLAVIFRALFAYKHVYERRQLDRHLNRRYVVIAGKPSKAEELSHESDAKSALLVGPRGQEEDVKVVKANRREVMPFRLSVDVPRALLVTLLTGVGYLLMLAVMTYNVGYFLSILAGTLVGELAIGRYGQSEEH